MKPSKPKLAFWVRFRGLIHRHPNLTLAGIGLVLILAAGTATLVVAYQPPKKVTIDLPAPVKPKPAPVYYSLLTGEKLANQAAETTPVTAVMIENSPDARPQSGLEQAGVVYEAIAEGGITRFMALYQNESPSLIGPVRSVRQYDLDWMCPYDASLAHVGGSAAALQEVRNGQWHDLDQFFNAGSYWRAADRYAPHNVYTTMARLNSLEKSKGTTASTFTGFDRTDAKPATTLDATHITINFSSTLYNTAYIYNAKTNDYTRYQAGAIHSDREKGPITPNVVVALHVDEKTVMQDGWRQAIQTSGSGQATIFQNGTAAEVTWHKPDQKSQLYFTDATGKRVALVRGQTWIAAIPNGEGSIAWTK